MIYFIRRFGKMFKKYGPEEDVVVIIRVKSAKQDKITGGWTPRHNDEAESVYWLSGNEQEVATSVLAWSKTGFMADTYVGSEHDLIKELFLKQKGRS